MKNLTKLAGPNLICIDMTAEMKAYCRGLLYGLNPHFGFCMSKLIKYTQGKRTNSG